MTKVITFTVGPIREHPYLVISKKQKLAIVIDPGGGVDEIIDVLAKYKCNLKYIINTHFHPDHISHNAILKDMTSARILIHKNDAGGLAQNWEAFSKKYDWPVIPSKADKSLKDGEVIKLEDISLEIIHTPGHTSGSSCVYLKKEKILFTGDTLFYHTTGRIDLPHSQPEIMKKSLDKLFKLPKNTTIYPGHGPSSTIGEEIKYNSDKMGYF